MFAVKTENDYNHYNHKGECNPKLTGFLIISPSIYTKCLQV
jgi:hypothetical protein